MPARFYFAVYSVAISLATFVVSGVAAQDRSTAGRDSVGRFVRQTTDGVRAKATIEAGRTATFLVARRGWGCQAEDVAAVCVSCAEMIFTAIKPDPKREPTVLIVRDAQGPMVLSQRAEDGAYIVLLNSGERRWAQVAYQFSHELGHVLCGDLSLKQPQRWFEEAFCESLSLWTLDKLGIAWKTRPPYPNWKDYAPHLTKYIGDVRDRAAQPTSLPDWYRQKQKHLNSEPYDRPANLVLARRLAAAAHANADFYQAFYYLHRRETPAENTMPWLLSNWQAHCPDKLKFAPAEVGKMLGVAVDPQGP